MSCLSSLYLQPKMSKTASEHTWTHSYQVDSIEQIPYRFFILLGRRHLWPIKKEAKIEPEVTFTPRSGRRPSWPAVETPARWQIGCEGRSCLSLFSFSLNSKYLHQNKMGLSCTLWTVVIYVCIEDILLKNTLEHTQYYRYGTKEN